MPLFDVVDPYAPIIKRAVELATPGGRTARESGAASGTTASPPLPTVTTQEGEDGYTRWPFMLGTDTLGGARAFLVVRGVDYGYADA